MDRNDDLTLLTAEDIARWRAAQGLPPLEPWPPREHAELFDSLKRELYESVQIAVAALLPMGGST